MPLRLAPWGKSRYKGPQIRNKGPQPRMADPTHQFVITPLLPLEVAGVDISFTNSAAWMALAAALSVWFLTAASGKGDLVPGRLQMAGEMLYTFIAGMIRENIGPRGREYFPLVFTVFVVVLLGNALGLIPWSFTYTSHIIVTGALALLVFFTVTIIGIARHGAAFFSLFVPPGVPWYLQFLVVPIEALSFLIRPVTLSVRLFINMMAGHLILKVFAGFSAGLIGLGAVGFLAGLLPVAVNVAILALEALVAVLQAYVFAVLTCIYLKDTVDLHH